MGERSCKPVAASAADKLADARTTRRIEAVVGMIAAPETADVVDRAPMPTARPRVDPARDRR